MSGLAFAVLSRQQTADSSSPITLDETAIPHCSVSVSPRHSAESEKAAQSGRAGVIEEVVAHDPSRFRVRWDDGRTSTFTPSAGVARIERLKKKRVKA
jgi:hypothetical protein